MRDRKLIVNEVEAETVRLIFKRHQEIGTIQALVADLAIRGVVSKRRVMRDGRQAGGDAYRAGALSHLLRNVLYTGRASHHGIIHAGEPMRDDRLIQLIASGHAAYDQLLAGEGKPGTTERSHLVRLARLRFSRARHRLSNRAWTAARRPD